MTTIAMSAGMIPATLAFGDGGEFRAPMAIAVVGGLLVSTFLSLVFVPSFYTIMDDASIGIGKAVPLAGPAERRRRAGAAARRQRARAAAPGRGAADRGGVGPFPSPRLRRGRSEGPGEGRN